MMHASLNISTGLLFGEIHRFEDSEFQNLAALIKRTFREIKQNVVARVIVNLLPEVVIRSGLCRRIIQFLLPTFNRMGDNGICLYYL